MVSRLDRWFKWLWLINGVLLLVLIVIAFGVVSDEMLRNWRRHEPAVDVTKGNEERGTRAVRYGPPDPVFGSVWSLILVRYGRAFQEPIQQLAISGSGYRSHMYGQPIVNVVFLNSSSGERHLLLDRPAHIREVRYPRTEHDSEQTWISYEIAFEDTNHDGRLDQDDTAGLYVTDLSGESLVRVTSDNVQVEWHTAYGDNKILTSVLDPRDSPPNVGEDSFAQRAFLYDVITGDSAELKEFDALIDTAGEILSK